MDKYPRIVKENLSDIIREMAASPELFVKNPGKDFTRTRKLPFETMAHLLISMGGNSIYKELLEAQGYGIDKILPRALRFHVHAEPLPLLRIHARHDDIREGARH
jgi:hypothetical protein